MRRGQLSPGAARLGEETLGDVGGFRNRDPLRFDTRRQCSQASHDARGVVRGSSNLHWAFPTKWTQMVQIQCNSRRRLAEGVNSVRRTRSWYLSISFDIQACCLAADHVTVYQ